MIFAYILVIFFYTRETQCASEFKNSGKAAFADYDEVPKWKLLQEQRILECQTNKRLHGPPQFLLAKGDMAEISASNIGYRHTLTCPYYSCSGANVTWIREDGKPIKARKWSKQRLSKIYLDDSIAELTIEDNRADDDGVYTCIITNQFGQISHSIQVKSAPRYINQPPVIKDELKNVTVEVGSNLTLVCTPAFKDPGTPNVIKWYRHYQVNNSWRNPVDDSHYVTVLQTTNDKPPPLYDTELYLSNLQVNDSGLYTCSIINHFGEANSTAFISVGIPSHEFQLAHAGIIGGIAGLLAVMFVAIYMFCSKKSKKYLEVRNTTSEVVKEVFVEKNLDGYPRVSIKKTVLSTETDAENPEMRSTEYIFQVDVKWEILRCQLMMFDEELGKGHYGKVVKGYLKRESDAAKRCEGSGYMPLSVHPANCMDKDLVVAVKMVKEESDSAVRDLVLEAEIMKKFGPHPNIINLVGVCSQPSGAPFWVVVEYACHGDLRNYLKNRKPSCYRSLFQMAGPSDDTVTFNVMISFAMQIAKGMAFLSSKKCVHRDLAARNVLIADGNVVKISDFGLARDVEDSDYYRTQFKKELPAMWMAPESLERNLFTTQSDVWSFGVLLWEIFTFGDSPYTELKCLPALRIEKIKNGFIMSPPPLCPMEIYNVMKDCWSFQPEQRPSWGSLIERFYQLSIDFDPEKYLKIQQIDHVVTPPPTPPANYKSVNSRTQQFMKRQQSSISSDEEIEEEGSISCDGSSWPSTADASAGQSFDVMYSDIRSQQVSQDHGFVEDEGTSRKFVLQNFEAGNPHPISFPKLRGNVLDQVHSMQRLGPARSSDSQDKLELAHGLSECPAIQTELAVRGTCCSASDRSHIYDRRNRLSRKRTRPSGSGESGYGTCRESESSDGRIERLQSFDSGEFRQPGDCMNEADEDSVFARDSF